MPLAGAFEQHRLVERVRALRKRPVAAYGVAIAAVGIATAIRLLASEYLMAGLPFITYYPAIIIATLVGGLWPGLTATVLSSVAAWYLFLPPTFSWDLNAHAAFSLLFFVFLAAINIGLIVFLDMAIDRVLAQEQNVRVLIESAPNGILVVDEGGRITLINASMERLFGYKKSELLGKPVEVLVAASATNTHRELRDFFMQKPETRAMGQGRDLSGRRKDGSEFPVEIGLNPVERNGKRGVLATVIDISERKRAQESQQLIIRELHHRTQNLFAVVQAIAGRTLDEGKTPAEAKQALNGRLKALAAAYATISDAAWDGARLSAMLEKQFVGFSERLNVSGCDIVLSPSAAQQFALIVHELSTNALKYGALSSPGGHVSIEGRTERLDGDEQFSFKWKESGGPPVSTPTRKGFGSVILIDTAKQFAETVTADYAVDGLNYELRLRLSAIEASAPKAKSESGYG